MSNVRTAALGLGLLVSVLAASARAEERPAAVVPVADAEAPVDRASEAPSGSRWYGLQVLGADTLAAGASIGCIEGTAAIPCVLPFMFGGSLVHAAHGNYGRAGLSLAARVALPAIGVMLGGAATKKAEPCTYSTYGTADGGTGTRGNCPIDYGPGGGVGAMIGIVAAMAVDAALAYDDAPPRVERTARRAPAVLPTMAVSQSDAVIGLTGRF